MPAKPYIKITKDGPYMAFGIRDITEKIILADRSGISVAYGDGKKFEIKGRDDMPTALCRCGKSKSAPFCDGSHQKEGFDGTETASFEPLKNGAVAFPGEELTLLDNQDYCAFARFCDAAGRIWNLVQYGGKDEARQAIKEGNLCPAGRFIILNRRGEVMEDRLPPSLSVIEDAQLGISGPLWVKGGIRVESEDGRSYEVRMKQTLCRCGHSENKPFCNGAHAALHWKAKRK